ncbi:hypothetical protein Aasi_0944 [Candidatus Amoebophilus asiaticus 5a2]|uniref:Uncharacterized protein n=1 Tax=Amoebophilus asiaticus (strain 5a2) TaxID=452471 RepID=B3ESV2_AMOA5|nr:ankyrin repeat domain-containing protein [Candidatus Amoebophilus asiaticus]ACE06304.1 hypothetical protein Aasi_0944 [Candidatus Amoebophilus asiaticus 5a2]
MKRPNFFTKGLAAILLTIHMISVTHAEIRFTEVQGIYQSTSSEHRAISPFWGLVAVHGKLLERIRFFGFYQKQTVGERLKDVASDKIAELLLELFPSLDGLQFVPNIQERTLLGKLSESKNLPLIKEIIGILLADQDPRVQETNLLPILKPLSNSSSKKYAKLLADAYAEQELYANPKENPTKQRYPENIVIISLLSFFIKAAENKSLLGLDPLVSNDIYDKVLYDKLKNNFPQIVADLENPANVELVFFLAKGFEAYENLVAEPVTYSKNITIQGGTKPFSDCGEYSLRNLFMLLLSVENGGMIAVRKLEELEEKVFKNRIQTIHDPDDFKKYLPYQNFKDFILAHSDVTYNSIELHSAWAEIVSNLNENSTAQGINRVQYGNKKVGADGERYEIKSNFPNAEAISIFNMFNVIARIIPDKTLNEGWNERDIKERYKQAEEKLTHLCYLFSNDNIAVDWRNVLTGDKKIDSNFMSIIFTINNQDALKWIFQNGHFDIERISTVKSDWRTDFAYLKYPNEWLASLFTNTLNNKEKEENYEKLLPLTVIYNASLKTLEGVKETIELVLNKKLENFYPLINRWVQQSIFTHSENPHFLIDMIEFIANIPTTKIDAAFQQQIIRDGMVVAKDKGLLEKDIALLAFKTKKYKAAGELIQAGANTTEKGERGNTISHLAVDEINLEIIDSLIEAGADIDINNDDGRTPLNLFISKPNAESPENLPIVEKLIRATGNINMQSHQGNTVLHLAVSQGKMKIFDMLINQAKPDVNITNKSGQTPLALAKARNNETAAEILRKHGATE